MLSETLLLSRDDNPSAIVYKTHVVRGLLSLTSGDGVNNFWIAFVTNQYFTVTRDFRDHCDKFVVRVDKFRLPWICNYQ